jgi:hypothetical protein
MLTENPYKSPQTSGSTPDNRRLQKRAKRFLAIAVVCSVLGVGLAGGGIYSMFGSRDIADSRGGVISPAEVANDIARRMPTAELLLYLGVPLAAIGGLVAVPSGILWFLTRKANMFCEEQGRNA